MLEKVESFEALKVLQVCTLTIRPEAVCMRYTQERVHGIRWNPFLAVIVPSNLEIF